MYAESFERVKSTVQNDDGFAWAWHCNLAMPMRDEGVEAGIANKCADRIMQQLFGVSTLESAQGKSWLADYNKHSGLNRSQSPQ